MIFLSVFLQGTLEEKFPLPTKAVAGRVSGHAERNLKQFSYKVVFPISTKGAQ